MQLRIIFHNIALFYCHKLQTLRDDIISLLRLLQELNSPAHSIRMLHFQQKCDIVFSGERKRLICSVVKELVL